jgi:group I intron endonuclease
MIYLKQNNKKISTIYCITNLITDKKYIGYTSYHPEYRYKLHLTASRTTSKEKDSKQHIHNAIFKHGADNFELSILYQSYNDDHCIEMETHFIKEYNTFGGTTGYNHSMGGEDRRRSEATIEKHRNKMLGKKQSEEHKSKRKLAQKGSKNYFYGKTPDPIKNKIYLDMALKAHKEYRNTFTYFYIDVWGNVFETKSQEFLISLMNASNWNQVKMTSKGNTKIKDGTRNWYRFKNGYKLLGCWKSLLE